jgi:IS5 family transposase
MKPRSRGDVDQLDLFQAQFDQILNPNHPLVVLAGQIDWGRFDVALEPCFNAEVGAPALPIRLMVGLLYLKHAFNESDESLLERWVENPYWQYFCGFRTFQHELPLHPTSLVKWRHRMGAERLAELLQETIALALREKNVTAHELRQVNVDTTVQEKNITHPTDSKLFRTAIEKLARAARERGLRLRQTYVRLAKRPRSRPADTLTPSSSSECVANCDDCGPGWAVSCAMCVANSLRGMQNCNCC